MVCSQRNLENKFQEEIMYGGSSCKLWGVYHPEQEPNWDDMCQQLINIWSKRGKNACVVHRGELHALYVEGIDSNTNF